MYLPRTPALEGVLIPSSAGVAGVLHTRALMRHLINTGKRDPRIRGIAVSLVALTPERDHLGEVRTIFEFVRDRIRYVSDVNDTETLHDPIRVYEMGAGDCDDKVILLGALLESIGYTTRIVVTGYSDPSIYDHVYLKVLLPDGRMMALDASEPEAPGWEPPAPLIMLEE